jgi:RNA polymerase sigma-70 factor (ECF subfamily)
MRFLVTAADTALAQIEEAARLPMDEDAFRAFYDRTARSLWAYLSRLTGDRQLADDLLQETFYRFCRAGATHENETHRRNSLFLIATNLVRDTMRRRQYAEMVPLETDAHHIDHHAAERTDGATDLARAMKQLKPAQRALLTLAYGQGASHAEIAEILGLKSASIKSLLFRARRRLAQLLERS